MADNRSTLRGGPEFDFDAFPEDTCFHDRRHASGADRPPRKERRRRIDPTTFEKQYTPEELEFMNAMQQFKVRSGRSFPSFGDVLKVARTLGYEKAGDPAPDPDAPRRLEPPGTTRGSLRE